MYGDRVDYPKINIFIRGIYMASTTWAKTCREARFHYYEVYPTVAYNDIGVQFDKPKQRRKKCRHS